MQQQPRRSFRAAGVAPAAIASLVLLLALITTPAAFAQSPITVSVNPVNVTAKLASSSQSRAYNAALTTLQSVIDAYAAKLATTQAAIDTARVNHDAKAGIRALATGEAANLAAARARAQAVVGAALANAIGQKCPNGSFPIPFNQRVAAIKASDRAAANAFVGALRSEKATNASNVPSVSIQIGNNQTSAASKTVAGVAAGVAQHKVNVLNATSAVWGPALTSLFNGVGSIGDAKVSTMRRAGNSLAIPTAAGRRLRLSRRLSSAVEGVEGAPVVSPTFDRESLAATTDDVEGLLNDAAEAYAESLLSVGGVRLDFPWAKTWNATLNGVNAARAAKNATRAAVRSAALALPPPLNTTAAALEALGAGASAAILAHKRRADAAVDSVTSEDAKEAVVRGIRTRVWALVQALDPRAAVDVDTGTGCLVPSGYYVSGTEILECPVNWYCTGGPLVDKPVATPCPAGTTTLGATGAGSLSNCWK